MKKILLLIVVIMAGFSAQAQKEANNWMFGEKCGITWNSSRSVLCTGLNGIPNATLDGLPDILPGAMINTDEGCFSLSDAGGNLLFYSDGIKIWDRNNQEMPNGTGLLGNNSAAQSGVIIPYPGHPNQYIAVTIGAVDGNPAGPAYSIVDMTLNNGLGDVTASKNIRLTGGTGSLGESLTVVKHANGIDYWIIVPGKGYESTTMNAWLVTASGINSTAPVKSPTTITTTSRPNPGGSIKISPDGKYFAWGVAPSSLTLIGNFDNSTGVFNNIILVGFSSYGVEFSRSGKYLYCGSSTIYAYDFALLLTNPTAAISGKKQICTVSAIGAIQNGPDGRMYISGGDFTTHMYVVSNPEEFNNLKVYRTPDRFVSTTGSGGHLGLPSFSGSWFVDPACYKPAITIGTSEPIKTIISTLDRTVVPRNMSDARAGCLILESKTRGFVLTRIASPETAITNAVEGMIVYDTTVKALKLYNGTAWKLLEQSCPDN